MFHRNSNAHSHIKRIPLFFVLILSLASCAGSPDKTDNLGYNGKLPANSQSVGDLLQQLTSDPNTSIRMLDGWTVAHSSELSTIWSFTPENHPAHPSVAKRKVIEDNGKVYIKTHVQCGAAKLVCDRFVQDFIELNDKVREYMAASNDK